MMSSLYTEEGEEGEGGAEGKIDITDKTDSKALTLRRTIYLTIMSRLLSHTHTHTHTHTQSVTLYPMRVYSSS